MNKLICQKCNSEISNEFGVTLAFCTNCGASIKNLQAEKTVAFNEVPTLVSPKPANFNSPSNSKTTRNVLGSFGIGFAAILLAAVGIFGYWYWTEKNSLNPEYFGKIVPPSPTPYKTPNTTSTTVPTPKKDYEVLLEFGGKGTSAGLFDRPREIAVDAGGNIYVADETLRVQHFDKAGNFVNLWNVSGKKNETIDKLAANEDGNIYVLIGGEIVVYVGKTGEKKYVLPDTHYIHDFVLRDDGGMMLATENNGRDEIVQTNKSRKVVRRFVEIHSRAAETQIPPQAVRLAVDGKGDIYAVYALGDVYGTFNYNEEDLMTFHFTANGKFVNKFAAELNPGAILIDNQSRIYLLNDNMQSDAKIFVFSNTGNEIKSISFDRFESIETMTFDKQNNLFIISGETIRKLKAIEF